MISALNVPAPDVGSQWSCTAKKRMRTAPSQNCGSDSPSSDVATVAESSAEPGRVAETTPRGIAIRRAIARPKPTSSNVCGRREATACAAGVSSEIDVPKSR
jgi:hypothetical protein